METDTSRHELQRVFGLRAAMIGDHAEQERLLERLTAACRADLREDVAEAFTAVERRLSGHLAFEQEVLFPELAKVDPYEVDRLLQDHARIRRALSELAVEVDLHLVRLRSVEAFVAMLRAHARREDDLLYRWAEEHLSESGRRRARRFLARLRRA